MKKQKSKSGYESEVTVYECEDCTDCPYKERCTKAKGNKRLYISKSFLEKRQESYENILSETGIKYRMNRSVQVEGAFGVLKNDYEFQKFLLRGKTKVKLSDFISDIFVADGMCADVAIHDPYPPGHNPHAHIIFACFFHHLSIS